MIFVAAMQQHPAASKQNTTKHNKTATNQTERTDFFLRFLYCFFFFFSFNERIENDYAKTDWHWFSNDLLFVYFFLLMDARCVCAVCVRIFFVLLHHHQRFISFIFASNCVLYFCCFYAFVLFSFHSNIDRHVTSTSANISTILHSIHTDGECCVVWCILIICCCFRLKL